MAIIMSGNYKNIAGYRFVTISDPQHYRQLFKEFCCKYDLKGTILLSKEGINFYMSGSVLDITKFCDFLEEHELFSKIMMKESYSDYHPYTRMLIKVKKEIIAIHDAAIKPEEMTGDHLSPSEFRDWMEQGKDMTILDTRNTYESRVGTFQNSTRLNIKYFSEFPDAIMTLPAEMKSKPLVMYCTGGIRCEKASSVLINAGFKEVYQIEGGILNYFENCGGDYWDGDCFVFDRRVALNPDLKETETATCYRCRQPLSVIEQQTPEHIVNVSCPYCISEQLDQQVGNRIDN